MPNPNRSIKPRSRYKTSHTLIAGVGLLCAVSMPTLAAATANDSQIWQVSGDFRLRYEHVEQDQDAASAPKPAEALTLRSTVALDIAPNDAFSARLKGEDSRTVGIDRFNDTQGQEPTRSVIADPETTELDEAWIRYKNGGHQFTLGRQLLNRDGLRMVGNVGWRQDNQSFEAFDWQYESGPWSTRYSRITERLQIFADERDIESKDHLFDLARDTSLGKVTGYYYRLQNKASGSPEINTSGIRLAGKKQDWSYLVEYAKQINDPDGVDLEANYSHVQVGKQLGRFQLGLGQEVLGSDSGNYGFATPLATLHKFNGWADQFLNTPNGGLEDQYLSVKYSQAGFTALLMAHDYSSDESSTVDDLGEELNLMIKQKLMKGLVVGAKAAAYRAGDPASNRIDADKIWLWASYAW